jgi:putative ABC transport system ATP-binding protein
MEIGDTYMIELKNIVKTYKMGEIEVHALQGMNLNINSGEMIAIMGPSGCGKSTLMNIIGCLDTLTSGQYILDGVDVSRLSDSQLAGMRNKKIGFVFQNYSLLPRTSALLNVELPIIYDNGKDKKNRAMEVLQRVGLADRYQHRPNELSGGEQQRVGIARALVNRPSIILADEPTGNLDSKSSLEVIQILEDLNRKDGITVVLVTHSPEIAESAQRIITLRDGQIISEKQVSKMEPSRAINSEVNPK